MDVISTIKEMKQLIKLKKQQGLTIGFVPTMGFLHEGHLSLVDHAKDKADVVVMSIFVNPLQFGEGEDFEEYPRNLERDAKLAQESGVDLLFYPAAKEVYPRPMSATLIVHEGVDVLCGASRPGHFDGVATVVMKLFQIVTPNVAFFGMKDAQQVAVIQRMVNDFHLDVKIIAGEIVREADGLAKSSRNVNLSNQERAEAPNIFQTLTEVKEKIEHGHFSTVTKVEAWINKTLADRLTGKVDYAKILCFPDLTEPTALKGKLLVAVAVYYDSVRLIDNITIERSDD